MELLTVVLALTYATTSIYAVPTHSPKVTEDEYESKPSEKESLRLTRNTEPTKFNFHQTKQQDYLKQRYAQQQQIDVDKISQFWKTNSNKQLLDDTYSKFLENPTGAAYDGHKNRQERDIKDVERQDIESELDRHVIFVDPKVVRKLVDLKAKRSPQIQSRSYKDINTDSLNDLIGKNPQVQLESLKRFLQQDAFYPVMETAQPFGGKDHTPVSERTVDIPNPQNRPNIQVSQNQPQTPHSNQAVTKETFERIQKQLEEASKFQVQNALERAQQAAQAHVAAQHKAIEQAQRKILENVQKGLYDNPQALALVQPKQSQYITHMNTPVHNQIGYSTPLPPQVVSPTQILNYKSASTTAVPSAEPNAESPTGANHNLRIIKVTQVPKHILVQPVVVAPKPQHYKAKEIEHYAPHHLHQTIAQLKAEKVLLQQIHEKNNAILNSNKALVKYVGQKGQLSREEENSEKEAQPTANTYQHVVLKQRQQDTFKKIQPEIKQDEENDDLQYASNYAFGYRVKDNKEGSDFGHEEKRDGKSAEGSYHVLLPDGRRQKVEYYADDNGYHAKVTYENAAIHK